VHAITIEGNKTVFSRKEKEKEKPEPEIPVFQNPFIVFELVDGVHLEISVGWPLDGDIKPFAQVLALLNSGNIVGPQLTEVSFYAKEVKQPEKAVIIQAALESIIASKKKEKLSPDRPLVPPSRVVANHLKNYTL
jgi:hypothetical protein